MDLDAIKVSGHLTSLTTDAIYKDSSSWQGVETLTLDALPHMIFVRPLVNLSRKITWFADTAHSTSWKTMILLMKICIVRLVDMDGLVLAAAEFLAKTYLSLILYSN